MPWVPIDEAGVEYIFTAGAGTVDVVDSVVVYDGVGAVSQWWVIELLQPITTSLRITALSYSAAGGQMGALYGPAEFRWDDGGLQVNTAPPYPDETYPNNDPVSAFTPSPLEIQGPLTYVEYWSTRSTGDEAYDDNSYEFLVEVWEEDPPEEVNYNCECDDPNPGQTLAQLRTRLMRRLGFSAMTSTPPPGMADLLNDFLQSAQEFLYRTYRVLRTERFYTWQMIEGVRYYDLDANQDVCTKKLDPRMITWVGVSSSDEWWQPLICGIPPEYYSWNSVQGWPERYEIRQCIEVWPAPDGNDWKLRIKGHFGLEPFNQDEDQTTIDSEAVFLFALARAKAHYGQPDAANYQTDAMNYIRNLTAGAHMTRRYVPGSRVEPNPIPPKWLPLGNASP